MTVPDPRLWCLHHIGPDDVHPAPDFATAQNWANWANREYTEHSTISRFVVAVWPWSPESHAEDLAESIAGWTLPATPSQTVSQDRAVEAALLSVLDAVQAYLPPDGISKDECLNRIIGAIDNPTINPVLAAFKKIEVGRG